MTCLVVVELWYSAAECVRTSSTRVCCETQHSDSCNLDGFGSGFMVVLWCKGGHAPDAAAMQEQRLAATAAAAGVL